MTDNEYIEYAIKNKDNLLKVHLRGSKDELIVVSINYGYVICYSENSKRLIRGWAGDFIY